jgi:hypothetical protein
MNHPTTEDWMDFLYRELPSRRRQTLELHLRTCADCRQSVAQWRDTMHLLNTWQLGSRQTQEPSPFAWFKWAAAAVLILGIGIGCGAMFMRVGGPASSTTILMSSIEQQVRSQVSRECVQALDALRVDLTNQVARICTDTLLATRQENLRLLDQFAAQVEAAQAEDQQVFRTAYQQLEQKLDAQVGWLRYDLETVAVKASDQLSWTRQKLDRLAVARNNPSTTVEPAKSLE